MIPAPSARLRRCRQSTGVGASCPATNKNRRYMTYEATRGYYTSRLLTACNLLASNMIVTHSKEVRDGNTCFKCSPLIRDAANKENLWEALLYKHISTVSKDMAPWGIMPTKQARDDDADH
ncbi:hypothetical protein CFC21_070683 [Triticum aestivum]|uniref:Uncharacterized protein n=2 Tax=Triticum aestivum TaxID=4565 RepID=A0A3B6LIZ9_WHEAT|nr:hypothetical protein CFC21_070683 [Triticum aestivum]